MDKVLEWRETLVHASAVRARATGVAVQVGCRLTPVLDVFSCSIPIPRHLRRSITSAGNAAKHVVPENPNVPIPPQIVPIRAMGHAPIFRDEAILVVAVVLKPQ